MRVVVAEEVLSQVADLSPREREVLALTKPRLAPAADDHRRVLAVLAYLQ